MIVKDAPCPSCRSVGRDRTGNHLMIFETGWKYCNRCKYKEDAEGNIIFPGHLTGESEVEFTISNSKSTSDSKNKRPVKFDSVQQLVSISCFGLSEKVIKQYGVKVEVSPEGEIINLYYPIYNVDGKLIGYKGKYIPHKRYSVVYKPGEQKKQKIKLFGQHGTPAYKPILVITEGENDALAAYQMLSPHFKKSDLFVVSVPNGANMKTILDNRDFIAHSGKIVTCFDQDEVGQKLTKDFWQVFPDSVVMQFSEKDAHDMLKKGKAKEFLEAYKVAETYKPSFIVTAKASEIIKVATQPIQYGLPTPWDGVTGLIYGIRKEELIAIGAAPGVGKSTFSQQLVTHAVLVNKQKVGMFSMEDSPEMLYRKLIGHVLNIPLDQPGLVVTKELEKKITSVTNKLVPNLFVYDPLYFNGKFEEIETALRFMAANGASLFVIDPISALVSSLDPSEQNRWLSESMFKLSKLVRTLGITIIHVNHLNDTKGNHETGGEVYASQFTGSKAQWRFSTAVIGLSRNLHEEDEDLKNTVTVKLLKARIGGHKVGQKVLLKYDKDKGVLDEIIHEPTLEF